MCVTTLEKQLFSRLQVRLYDEIESKLTIIVHQDTKYEPANATALISLATIDVIRTKTPNNGIADKALTCTRNFPREAG